MAYVFSNDREVVIGGPLAYRASLNMDKRLNNLVQKLINEKVIDKIALAPNDADKISEYFRIKESLGEELSDFIADAVTLLEEFQYVVEKEKAYSTEEAICLIFVCIMTGVELKGMIMNDYDAIKCLSNGLLDDTDSGCRIWMFFELDGEKLNNYSEEELIIKFFH